MGGIVRQKPSAGRLWSAAGLAIGLALCVPSGARADIPGATLTKLTVSGKGVVGRMAIGPDGNVWFLDEKNSAVGKMVVSGSTATLTEYPVTPPAGQRINFLHAFAAGTDALWLIFQTCGNLACTQSQANLGRVATDGTITLKTITGWSDVAQSLVAGPDGNFWTSDPNDRIVRVTPDGIATTFKSPSGKSAAGPIVGPDQAIWFGEGSSIGRLSSAGAITEYPTGVANAFLLTSGPDNNVWFVAGANKIGRMKTDGAVTIFTLPDAQASPGGLAFGPDGNLWFTEHFDPKVGRLVVSTAKDDGTAQIDVQSVPGLLGRGGDIVTLPASASSSGLTGLLFDYSDATLGTSLVTSALTAAKPDLQITKRHFFYNKRFSYIFEVANNGKATYHGPITVTDLLPLGLEYLGSYNFCQADWLSPGYVKCVLAEANLPSGGRASLEMGVLITAEEGTAIVNQATLSTPLGIAASNVDRYVVGQPNLIVTKQRVDVFGNDAWQVTVTNAGNVPTDGTISVTDPAPPGITWEGFVATDPDVHCVAPMEPQPQTISCSVSKTLGPGESIDLPLFVPHQFPKDRIIENVATVKGGGAPEASSAPATTSPPQVRPVAENTVQPTKGK